MQLFRHTGVIIAVFWCAAMIVAPMAAAGQDTNQGSVPHQGMNPGQGYQGNNQVQPGQETGSGNGQNHAGPGQGSRPQETGRWNTTGFGNHTPFADDGNLTVQPEKPDRNPDNATAFNTTARHGPRGGNMTGMNRTDIPPPGDWDPSNMTAVNQTWHAPDDGNLTPPVPPRGDAADPGHQEGQNRQQAQNLDSRDSIIAEILSWFKDHGVS